MASVQTFLNGQLVASEVVPDDEVPVAADPGAVIASVAAMTADQKAALRAALGL